MKVVILAGGYGTRISEESHLKPKPMIEIGGRPLLWHIMKHYSHYGHKDFIICAGYRQHVIKEWFADYFLHNSDITFRFKNGKDEVIIHDQHCEPWDVTVVDTGLDTMTGGRVKRVRKYIGEETFMLTYGDGVSSVDLAELLEFHKKMGKIATVTSVKAVQNKGVLDIRDSLICKFREKSDDDSVRINGGFMVLEPAVFGYLEGDGTTLEREPMDRLADEEQLAAFKHDGFWQCMDTRREMDKLEGLWMSGVAPWKTWLD